jgi:hemerythrin
MELITWNKSYETGHPIIDGQHKKLFSLVNQLNKAIEEKHTKLILADIIEKLSDYVATHFKTEEEIMIANKFPSFELHKKQHEELKEQAFKLIKLFNLSTIDLSATISKFLSDWLKDHILEKDVKMISWLKEKSAQTAQ